MKPVIGVTGPDKGGDAAWWFTRLALFRAGAKAVRITPSRSVSINSLNGLIIGGGADVNPELYGQKKIMLAAEVIRKKKTFFYTIRRILLYPLVYFFRKLFSIKYMVKGDDRRDDLEYRLIQEAFEKTMPVLGICRGSQLINVYLGGTLFQDLKDFYTETPQFYSVFPKKRVLVKPFSRLSGILGRDELMINALHRQAIRDLGKGVQSAAVEPNQIIQAIEYPSHPFAIGVQWHPEYLPQHKVHQNIFQALVKAARLCTKLPR